MYAGHKSEKRDIKRYVLLFNAYNIATFISN
jgi:hypothetical protein